MWQQFMYRDHDSTHPYAVYTPDNYSVSTAVPLIVMLHGCSQTALDFAAGTLMNQIAEQYNFIVVYPQQTSKHNQNLCWNWFLPAHQVRGSGEPASIVGIVQEVQQTTDSWTIDATRIYAAGLSAGGAMATILGITYPDLFAAIGTHSAPEYQAATNISKGLRAMRHGGPDPLEQGIVAHQAMGDFARVVPCIMFHGMKDNTVVATNGDQVVQQWMKTNELASHGSYMTDFSRPSSVVPGQVLNGYSYITARWNDSDGAPIQEYWKIGHMGHAWSGGSPAGSYTDPLGPNASLAMYLFFIAHSLPTDEESSIDQEAEAHAHKSLRERLINLLTLRRGKQI